MVSRSSHFSVHFKCECSSFLGSKRAIPTKPHQTFNFSSNSKDSFSFYPIRPYPGLMTCLGKDFAFPSALLCLLSSSLSVASFSSMVGVRRGKSKGKEQSVILWVGAAGVRCECPLPNWCPYVAFSLYCEFSQGPALKRPQMLHCHG